MIRQADCVCYIKQDTALEGRSRICTALRIGYARTLRTCLSNCSHEVTGSEAERSAFFSRDRKGTNMPYFILSG